MHKSPTVMCLARIYIYIFIYTNIFFRNDSLNKSIALFQKKPEGERGRGCGEGGCMKQQ